MSLVGTKNQNESAITIFFYHPLSAKYPLFHPTYIQHTKIFIQHTTLPLPPCPRHNWLPLPLFLQLNDCEIRKGKKIGVTISYNNHRLFVGYIPKNRDRDDLLEEFSKHARKLSNTLLKQQKTKQKNPKKLECDIFSLSRLGFLSLQNLEKSDDLRI